MREGFFADLVLVDPNAGTDIIRSKVLSKCGWSPFEGEHFNAKIAATFVNGELAYDGARLVGTPQGQRLRFAR